MRASRELYGSASMLRARWSGSAGDTPTPHPSSGMSMLLAGFGLPPTVSAFKGDSWGETSTILPRWTRPRVGDIGMSPAEAHCSTPSSSSSSSST
eukprot:CAMPEP_0114149638 /NCGR_PEP_ID=MMETSP0043_2-20121206/22267_1 /TAXON_ID=464988 /ORGANISM="Hemiselmis andersenii, Strain CCMP644" /LENGTH=94 /DNA_ID=CAMNT_0001244297 /DNA_START=153 /DNA_END=434 /DNA_ORIENTATION=+